MKTITVLVVAALCAAIGDTFLSRGMRSSGAVSVTSASSLFDHLTVVVRNYKVTLGVIFMGTFFYLYLASLSWGDLSFVKPITSLSFLFATILATTVLREEVSWYRWAGTIFIVLGVLLVALDRDESPATSGKPPATAEASAGD